VASIFLPSSSSGHVRRSRLASVVDSVFAIGLGLALRVLLDVVNADVDEEEEDVRVAAFIIGLWEGVVLHHFLRKWSKLYDPYFSYAVRLFIDYLVTESLTRMVLVILWTGVGVVLADIGPSIWKDSGLKRVWHRFRKDISYGIPSLVSKTSRVRFHDIPARSSADSIVTSSPTDITASYTTRATNLTRGTNLTGRSEPPLPVPIPRARKPLRAFPGGFPGDISETESLATSRSSIRTVDLPPLPPSTAVSARGASDSGISDSTETASVRDNLSEIPDEAGPKTPTRPNLELTPRRRSVLLPSDSPARASTDTLGAQPPLSDIPNMVEEGWENVQADDAKSAKSKRRSRTPPPPFSDVYGSQKDPLGEEDLDDDLLGTEAGDDPLQTDMEDISILSEPSEARLKSALTARKELAALRGKVDAAEKERQQAVAGNKRALAITKKKEYNTLLAELKAREEKIAQTIFTIHNKTSAPDRVIISDLTEDEAVERVEEALTHLLQVTDDKTKGTVTEFMTAPKVLQVKVREFNERLHLAAVRDRMRSYGFMFTDDPDDPCALRVHLPKE
jgi:hypothetical protein